MHYVTVRLFVLLVALATHALAQVPGACTLEDSSFQTLDGGCKDLSTGLVWSADYYMLGGTALDFMAAEGYAQNLVEGGFDDWRLPTRDELLDLHTNGGSAHLNLGDAYHWSSTKSGRKRYIVRISSGEILAVNRTSLMLVICVREVSIGGGGGGGGHGGGGGGGGGGHGGGGGGDSPNPHLGGSGSPTGSAHAVRFVRGDYTHVRLTAAEHAGRTFAVVAHTRPALPAALPAALPDAWLGMPDLVFIAPGAFDPMGRAHLAFDHRECERLTADGVEARLGILVLDPAAGEKCVVDAFLVHRSR